jgi:hypothetical protein
MLAVVEALLFGVDGYEGVPEADYICPGGNPGSCVWHDEGGRSEYVIDCIFDQGDVLYNGLQAV